MSSGVILSPTQQVINKTRNAILRMKKCSPELRTVLRQRCQERIQNDRLKLLHSFRKIKIQDSFRIAFGNILKEEWKSINEESSRTSPFLQGTSTDNFNLEENLFFEELLEKELLAEHEDWLLQLYEEIQQEDVEEDMEGVVCPLCCSGYLKQVNFHSYKRTFCQKCPANFVAEKSLPDLQVAIFESLEWHDRECCFNSSFISVPKNEKENNLCIVCQSCSHLNIIG